MSEETRKSQSRYINYIKELNRNDGTEKQNTYNEKFTTQLNSSMTKIQRT